MNAPTPIASPANQLPPAAVALISARLLNKHSAHEIAEAIEILIDVLDLLGGDPDVEANGDEEDGTGAEDEEGGHTFYASGPGCAISDPDVEHDGREHEEGE